MEFAMILTVGAAGFAAAFLKLYSGFGLGTLLLPVFASFYPIPTAVALTAIVHLGSNLFKLGLVGRYADRGVLIGFGLPAALAAFAGAFLLKNIPAREALFSYEAAGHTAVITPLKLVIAALMLVFAAMEALPALKKLEFDRRYLPLGGILSGFFGGLSGHQGAFRSAFLTRSNLSVQAFVGTGVVIACIVDLTRLAVYNSEMDPRVLWTHAGILITAMIGTSAGAWTGNLFIKKIKMSAVRILVAVLLAVYAGLLGAGIL